LQVWMQILVVDAVDPTLQHTCKGVAAY